MEEHSIIKKELRVDKREDIAGFETLIELALDLTWSWNHRTDKIWRAIDTDLWEFSHNPWIVLQSVSKEKLEHVLSNPEFRKLVDELAQERHKKLSAETWFQKTHAQTPLTCAAYFSLEFMLSEALPIYSGGLGNVAGDQLKAASDLGVPVVAVGLLYQQGYFRQMIDQNGVQQALYPYNDPGQLPITPLRKSNGEWLRLEVALPGWPLWLRTWQVQVGRVQLYLLDSNDLGNNPVHRGITSELYGGGSELRLKQELALGIGGWRLLEALGLKPEVCHLNEGHAAFAVVERAYSFMKATGKSFEEALAVTRAGNLFTTHTAVSAGFDLFAPDLIEKYVSVYVKEKIKISVEDFLALGRINPKDPAEPFNMAYLALRGCGAVNGVSQLHGKVSRRIFQVLFPQWPEADVPVSHVTNGVHMPSWDSVASDEIWTTTCGKSRWLGLTDCLEKEIGSISETKIWQMRNANRKVLVDYARQRLSMQLAARGSSAEEIELVKHIFDPNTLTLGFARRFATYKRPNMLLQDPDRLVRILSNAQRPVQLIIAGKAHPKDLPGQAMIQQWIQFIVKYKMRSKVMFLSDYDMDLTQYLVQGVDVWINTPRRPWEACGTSGMKVLVNGGLNLSELDGWWAEAYTPEVGWAIGDGREHGDDPAWDAVEATALYNLLERQVVPEFYTRDPEGIPLAWVRRIRDSMARLTPQFSANRAVHDYVEQHYLPAASAYLQRAANQGAAGSQIVAWKKELANHWQVVRFSGSKIETKGDRYEFDVNVYLDELSPTFVKVELYAENPPVHAEMTCVGTLPSDNSTYVFRGSVPANRPALHYTPRVVPQFPGVAVPLEAQQICWLK